MKKFALTIAAAAAFGLTSMGAASADVLADQSGHFQRAPAAKVQLAHYVPPRHHHRGRRGRHLGPGHGYAIGNHARCRRLYYRGYVMGNYVAWGMFNRFCTYHPSYNPRRRYGPYGY